VLVEMGVARPGPGASGLEVEGPDEELPESARVSLLSFSVSSCLNVQPLRVLTGLIIC
jgi:hypothetical protein